MLELVLLGIIILGGIMDSPEPFPTVGVISDSPEPFPTLGATQDGPEPFPSLNGTVGVIEDDAEPT